MRKSNSRQRLWVGLGAIGTLIGCGSNGGGSLGDDLLVTSADEAAGANCPYGGVSVTRGVDANADGVLNASEDSDTQYVCNGTLATRSSTQILSAGDANCASGGAAISRGEDTNANGTLDAAEVNSTVYVCNGAGADQLGSCVFPAAWDAATSSCVQTTDWSGAALGDQPLANAYLADLNLSGVDLTGKDLRGSNLGNTDLSNATLIDADLRGATLADANLSDAVLDGANLSGVDLSQATLDGVSGTHLVSCPLDLPQDWSCMNLGATGNTLLGPDTVLDGLDLSGALLSNADLDGLQAIHLLGCPETLPDQWQCLEFPQTGMTLVGPEADLSRLDLRGADFSSIQDLGDVNFAGANLVGVSFGSDTNLENANFTGADLTNVSFGADTDLGEVNFKGANLSGVHLATANLDEVAATELVLCPEDLPEGWSCLALGSNGNTLVGPGADLSELDLTGLDLSGLNLTGSNLRDSTLRDATLSGAALSDAELEGATLRGLRATNLDGCPDSLPEGWDCVRDALVGPGADLPGVDLQGADLTDVDFNGAELPGADLSGANLSGVDMTEMDLAGANLTGANLSHADLSAADLTDATLTAVIWSDTTCPNGTNSDDNGGTCL